MRIIAILCKFKAFYSASVNTLAVKRVVEMQEVVRLNMAVRSIKNVVVGAERSGFVFFNIALFSTRNTVTTDRFLISDEAVRVLNIGR